MLHLLNKTGVQVKQWKLMVAGLLMLSAGCGREMAVLRITQETKTSGDGIYYYLPRTVIIADVRVRKTTYLPGPYQEYAEKYLGYPGISKKSVQYELVSVELKAVNEPDPEQVYMIEMHPRSGVLFEFEDNGVLRHVNAMSTAEERNESRDAIAQQQRTMHSDEFRMSPLNLREKTDTIYRREVYEDSVVVERWQIEKVLIRSTQDESAREAAARLAAIRNNRFQLISFNEDVQYPAGTLEIMLQELARMEEDYFRLFTGYNTEEELRYQFRYVPSVTDQGFQPLFKFSPMRGVNDSLKLVSETVYITQESLGLTTAAKQMRGDRYLIDGKPPGNPHGLAYRQPELVKYSVIYNGKMLASAVLPVAQMGFVQRLSLKKLNNSRISFDPSSGAIRIIEVKGKK